MNSSQIKNYNQLEAKSIELVIDRIPNVNFFCTSASLPGISATAVRQPTPFTDVKHTGDKLVFQPLIVNFIVDESMANWKEIFDWMVSYGTPDNFEQFVNPSVPHRQQYRSKLSDARLLIPNNLYNTQHEYTFEDVFPIDISDIVFDTQISGVSNAVCTATFEYTQYYKSP